MVWNARATPVNSRCSLQMLLPLAACLMLTASPLWAAESEAGLLEVPAPVLRLEFPAAVPDYSQQIEAAPDEMEVDSAATSGTAPAAEEAPVAPLPPPPPPQTSTPPPAEKPGAKSATPDEGAALALRGLQELYEEAPTALYAAPPPVQAGGLLDAGLRTFLWLCVLCALIILAGYLLKRFGQRTPLLAGQRLGVVLGRVHLDPKAAIHYVRTGGRVLLLGVTPQQVTLLTEFDASAFEEVQEMEPAPDPRLRTNEPAGFLAQLQANHAKLQAPDDELVTLRSDIQRLQQSLQEKMRDPH